MCKLVLNYLVVLLLAAFSNAVLLGRLRNRIESGSNVLPSPRFFYPIPDEPAACKTDLGHPGICADIRFCSVSKFVVQSGNHPIRCGWVDNFTPKVCCHPDHMQHPKLVLPPARYRESRWKK